MTSCFLGRLLFEELLAFLFQRAGNAVGQEGEHLGEVELDLHRVGEHVDAAGDFLAESAAFELELIAFPALLEGDHAADDPRPPVMCWRRLAKPASRRRRASSLPRLWGRFTVTGRGIGR